LAVQQAVEPKPLGQYKPGRDGCQLGRFWTWLLAHVKTVIAAMGDAAADLAGKKAVGGKTVEANE
jgi:hypothetical protein